MLHYDDDFFTCTQASMPARYKFLKALPATAEGCVPPVAIRIPFGNFFYTKKLEVDFEAGAFNSIQ